MTREASPLRIHSKYDPAGEADRYLVSVLEDRHPSCILILGGGEDWLAEAARNRFPASRILSIHFDPSLRGLARKGADACWYPDGGKDLNSFLSEGLSGHMDGGVGVLLWKPSEAAFPELAAQVLISVRSLLEETSSDAATIRYWSQRWARNAIRNFLDTDRYVSPLCSDSSIVIAAAGPSLETSLRQLLPYRKGIRLWALASAWGACIRASWNPELLLTTDAGLWSDRHFDAFLRAHPEPEAPMAALLTARIPARARERCKVLLLSQGHPLESDFTSAAGLSFLPTKPRGTASADAITLALECSTGPLILAGLDMACLDLRSHCRPYGFDSVLRRPELRLRPHLSILWKRETAAFPIRSGAWRRGRSFDLYASGIAAGRPRKIFRLSPSPVPVPGTLPLYPQNLAALLSEIPPSQAAHFQPAIAPDRAQRTFIAQKLLEAWEAEMEVSIRNAKSTGLSLRSRQLLYAFAGPSAAPFLAEASRNRYDKASANQALHAVHESVSGLRRSTL